MNFDSSKYKGWNWYHITRLLWMINPFGFYYELILGWRIPKITLVEKNNKNPLYFKLFVPCPHCNEIHSYLKWTPQNHTKFKNWFGLYCDNCGNIIPCIRNIFCLLFLTVTYPFWFFLKENWRNKWLSYQKLNFQKPLYTGAPVDPWWYLSMDWAIWMTAVTALFEIFYYKVNTSVVDIVLHFLSFLTGALIFGLILRKSYQKHNGINRNRQPGYWEKEQ